MIFRLSHRQQALAARLFAFTAFLFASQGGLAVEASLDDCLRSAVVNPANNARTVNELRELCSDSERSSIIAESTGSVTPVTDSLNALSQSPYVPFFEPYKSNYIVFGSLENQDGGIPFSGESMDIKFELGMKFSVFPQIDTFDILAPLKFGYSQRSWWDIAESSAPFKEHNYNPELFWDFEESRRISGHTSGARLVDLVGFEHQSNGLDGVNSRSWDRVYAQREFRYSEMFSWTVKLWEVVKEGEFNEDINDYLGNTEITTHIDFNNWADLDIRMFKGDREEKISYQVDLILPMSRWISSRFVVSYHEGFGEALVTYNKKTKSLRAGFYFPLGF